MTSTHRFGVALVLTALAAALAAAPAQAQAPAPDFRLGHFKCYGITNAEPVDTLVGTQDQFDIADKSGFEPTFVRIPFRFCNPVAKLHRNRFFDIPDRSAHLTMYLTVPSDLGATRRVAVANQFGRTRLRTFSAPVLATPTAKNNEGFPEELDHYKCYRADGKSANAVVSLRDQFHAEERVKVGRPLLFCNPTRKIHREQAFGVQNARDHLVCYQLERRPFEDSVATLDQFGPKQLRVADADMLCAPTAKLAFDQVR